MKTLGLQTPDITLAQLLAAFTWVATEAVTVGLVDNQTEKLGLSVGVTVITAAWTVADSIIRNGRAHAAAAIHSAELLAAAPPSP